MSTIIYAYFRGNAISISLKTPLDSYSLLAYCEGEEDGKHVKDILKKATVNEAEIFVCIVNWGEMYYIALAVENEIKIMWINTA